MSKMKKRIKKINKEELFTKKFYIRIIKEIKEKSKRYFNSNVLFTTYILVNLFNGFLLRLLTINSIELKAFLCDFIIIILIGCFGYLIKPKNQFKYFFSCTIFFTALCVINAIYYTFYVSYVSVSLISTLSMLGDVGDSVTTKIKLIYFIYFIAPLIMVIINHKLCKKNYYFEVSKIEKGKQMFTKTGIVGLSLVFLVIITLQSTEASRLIKQWNRDYIVQRFGLYLYTINDIVQSIEPKVSTMFGYDSSAKLFRNFYNEREISTNKNKYTNIFEGKNVIFIHMESIQNFLIDLEINGTTITPYINKLAKEGLYFSSFYPQISVGTSSDTEFTLSTGLLPSSSGTVFVNYYNRQYETLQNLFNQKGYYTFSMHANNADYWNRKTMYKTLGYQHFYAKDSFEVPESKEDPDYVGLGLSDKSFLSQAISKLQEIKNNNNNFMGTIITLSNHSPFGDITKYGNLDFSITYQVLKNETDELGNQIMEEVKVDYLENTEMGNYLKSAHYADEALGQFFNDIVTNGLDENTVFILYGDHEAKLGKKNLNLLYNYDPYIDGIKDETDPTYLSLDNYKYDLLRNTPFIIWTSDKQIKKEITDVMGMWDVLPTVSNMFGLTYHYALGNDIFSSNEKIVVFPSGNILTNKLYYSNLHDEYILLNNEPINVEYIEELKKYADDRLEVSKGIILHDLIKNEASKLEE